jgi:glycosyltransferase involved in cell wall biosynthesis
VVSQHVDVCICTYRRPRLLKKLLTCLREQRTESLFTCSVIVVDNDVGQSARQTVDEFRAQAGWHLRYEVEPVQNIALARNRAVQSATGDFLAFIDDDEYPGPDWLITLVEAQKRWNADGILGPVIPHYETEPPSWVIRGGFYERPSHATGTKLDWKNTRTGNALLRRSLFQEEDNLFRQEFGGGGEDRDFFRRMIRKGHVFIWCAEAPVYESIPPERFKRSFMLKRALVRGKIPHFRPVDYAKSLLAIPLYTLALPVLPLLGHHVFMKVLIRDFDHIGRLLSLAGIDVVKEKYVTQ